MNQFSSDFVRLMVSIAIGMPISFWVLVVVRWMIDGDITPMVAFIGIGVALGLATLAIWAPHLAVAATIMVVTVTSLVVFPFILQEIDKRAHTLLDTRELEKAYIAFGEHPESPAARFAIALALHKHGYVSSAVAISEETSKTLSAEVDPVNNRSMHDIFDREIRSAKNWREESGDRLAFKPLKCRRCAVANKPSAVVCQRCSAPYLLDFVRDANHRGRFVGKLVIAWSMVAVVITGSAWAGASLAFGPGVAVILGLVVACGGIVAVAYRTGPVTS